VETLATLFEDRREPTFIRSDNGPEFIAKAVKQLLEASGVETLYVKPGSSVAECLLRDVHRALRRRATIKEGGVRQPAGSEGVGRGV
jgi:hypothetical protein